MGSMKWRPYLPLLAGMLTLAFGEEQTLPAAGDENHAAVTETRAERNQRMAWWREAKFGMFIHYGLYSGLGGEFKGREGGGEWIQKNLNLDTESYAAEALPRFQPAPGCTDEWAALAKEAGCRYMVLTTKHHEGFALWDSDTTDFCLGKQRDGRDLVREFTDSARAQGMRVGFYHSVIDWHHPDYDNTINPDLCYPAGQEAMLKERGVPRNHKAYQDYLRAQVSELLTRYGQIDVIWWDYSQGAAEGERGWRAPELIRLCREKQPGIIMNNRLYSFSGLDPKQSVLDLDLRCGDFTTPEKRIPAAGYPGMDWESCMTVGDKWGYHRFDRRLKTPATVIRQLEQCAARGGNLLLNIGPRADGSVPERVAEVFRRVGQWMKINGESIYGTRMIPDVDMPEGTMMSGGDEDLYVFLPEKAPEDGSDYVLRLRSSQIDAVRPEILGQPEVKLKSERVEEEGDEEPIGYYCVTIPARVWTNAVEGMPVLKLANDN